MRQTQSLFGLSDIHGRELRHPRETDGERMTTSPTIGTTFHKSSPLRAVGGGGLVVPIPDLLPPFGEDKMGHSCRGRSQQRRWCRWTVTNLFGRNMTGNNQFECMSALLWKFSCIALIPEFWNCSLLILPLVYTM